MTPHFLPPAPRLKHTPPPKGSYELGEALLCGVLAAIAIASFILFWRPFRDDVAMVAADKAATQRPALLIDIGELDGAMQALVAVRQCAYSWRQELGPKAEMYCLGRVDRQLRMLSR